MNIPLGYITRKRPRRRHERSSSPPPPGPLALVAAVYDGGANVVLTFDRAVDIDAVDPSQVVVNDAAITNTLYVGGSATLVDAVTVQVELSPLGSPSGSGVTMDASATTGIVAVGDGATWAGVSGVELPFG